MDSGKRRKLKQPSVFDAFEKKKDIDGEKSSDGEKDEIGKNYYDDGGDGIE